MAKAPLTFTPIEDESTAAKAPLTFTPIEGESTAAKAPLTFTPIEDGQGEGEESYLNSIVDSVGGGVRSALDALPDMDEDSYVGMAAESISHRFWESLGLTKSALKSIAKPLDEGFIPENDYMAEGVRGTTNAILGAAAAPIGILGAAFSPLAPIGDSASYVVEEGIKRTARQMHLSRDGNLDNYSEEDQANVEKYAGYVGTATEMLSEGLFGPAAIKLLMKVPKFSKAIKAYGALSAGADDVATVATKADDVAAAIPGTPTGIHPNKPRLPSTPEAGLSHEINAGVLEASKEAIDAGTLTLNQGEKMFNAVARGLNDGTIIPDQWPQLQKWLMNKYGFTKAEADIGLANEFMAGMSESGRSLNFMSQLKKKMGEVLDADAMDVLNSGNKLPPETLPSMIYRGFKKGEKVRRSLLVTQIGTASRNFTEQAARFSVSGVSDAMEGVLRLPSATLRGKPMEAFDPLFQDFLALGHRLSPTARNTLGKVLDAMPIQGSKLMSRPVADLTMGKIADKLNTVNRVQEHFYRKLAFEARFRTNLNKAGMKFDDLASNLDELGELSLMGDKTSKSMKFNKALDDAIEHALEVTYARTPTGGTGSLLSALNNPIATAVVNPYPRFWINSLKYLHEYNPTGIMSLMSPASIKAMSSGRALDTFAPVMAKAMTGSLMLGAAGAIRESQYGEDRPWYQINMGDGKVVDARPFGATARYLLLWDAIFHPERLKPKDYMEGFFITGRVAGTGLMLADILRAKDKETGIEQLKKWVGQYAGGFTTPVRTLKDMLSAETLGIEGVTHEGEVKNPLYLRGENIERTTREDPWTGPMRMNIPLLSQTLPERTSVYNVGPMKTEHPVLRQLIGLSPKTKTDLEREVNNLGVDYQSVYPRTGVPKADRLIVREMGPIIRKAIMPYIKRDDYKRLPPESKRLILKKLFSMARKVGEAYALRNSEGNPEERAMFEKIRYEKAIPRDIRDLVERRRTSAPAPAPAPRVSTPSAQIPVPTVRQRAPATVPMGKGLIPESRTREILNSRFR